MEGLSTCERLQCDTTVGYGGSPDEKGETRLDAIIIDGYSLISIHILNSDWLRSGMKMGGVAGMRRIRDAARVAWSVLNYTRHTIIVGEAGSNTDFNNVYNFFFIKVISNNCRKITVREDFHFSNRIRC